jgi:YVTN family beta-propeller protein
MPSTPTVPGFGTEDGRPPGTPPRSTSLARASSRPEALPAGLGTVPGAVLRPPQIRWGAAGIAPLAAPPSRATVPVGAGPVSLVISQDGTRAYVSDFGSGAVSVISTATKTVTATIPVAGGPWGLALSPGGQRLYVACHGGNNVSVVDTAAGTAVGTVPEIGNPVHLAVTPGGARLFVACQATNSVKVINTATNTVIAEIPVGIGPRNLVIAPDGLTAYVSEEGANAVSVIDTTALAVTARITGFLFPRVPAITQDGRRLFVPNFGGNTVDVVDTATHRVVASVPGFSLPFAVTLSKGGQVAYVSGNGDGTVRAISTGTYQVIATYGGLNVPYWVAVTPDDQSVYVVNNGGSAVTVLPRPSGVYPNQGPTSGGTRVTILGTNLRGTIAVRFGSRLATDVVVVSDNEVTAVSPPGHGAVMVTVTTPGGTSNGVPFYYIEPPRIGALTPASGPTTGGTTVTITGKGLATARSVTFGTTAVIPTVQSDSSITVTAPPGPAGTVPVVVTAIGGIADEATYTYVNGPGITGIAPTGGPTAGGNHVAITGTDLSQTTAVFFGSTRAAFVIVSATQLDVVVPPHAAGQVTVTVTTPGGTATAPSDYTYA